MLFINLQCTTVTKDTPKLNTVAPSTQSCPDGRGLEHFVTCLLLWLRPVWDVVLLLPLAQLSWK